MAWRTPPFTTHGDYYEAHDFNPADRPVLPPPTPSETGLVVTLAAAAAAGVEMRKPVERRRLLFPWLRKR